MYLSRLLTKLYFTGLPFATMYHGINFKKNIEEERLQSLAFHMYDNVAIEPNNPQLVAKEVTNDIQMYKIEKSQKYTKLIISYPLDLMCFGTKYAFKIWNRFNMEKDYNNIIKLIESVKNPK